MDIHKLRDVLYHAGQYKIKCTYLRNGDGSEFDYTIVFNETVKFTNGHKAIKFIDDLVEENKLSKFTKPYRVGFGWEIY